MKWSILGPGKQSGVYIIDDFLSTRECAALIRRAHKYGEITRSFAGYGKPHGDFVLTSTAYHDVSKTILEINKRVSRLTGLPLENGESLITIRYTTSNDIADHNDYVPDKKKPHTGRIAQVLFYLNDVQSGGETYFPNMGLKIVPKKGRAVLWYGIQGMSPLEPGETSATIPKSFKENPYAIHKPLPFAKGEEKWIATLQIHEKKVPIVTHIAVHCGDKSCMLTTKQVSDVLKTFRNLIPVDPKKVTKKEAKPNFDKISTYMTDEKSGKLVPYAELNAIAMKDNCFILRIDNLYYKDDSKGKLKKLLENSLNVHIH